MDEDKAAARFWILQANRLFGLLLALAGIMILAGRIDAPQPVGAIAMLVGVIDFFLVPVLVARAWKRGGRQ